MEKRFYLKSELGKMLMPGCLNNPTRALFERVHKNEALMATIEKAGYRKNAKMIAADIADEIISAYSKKTA